MSPAEMMQEAHAVLREPFLGRRRDLVGKIVDYCDALDALERGIGGRRPWTCFAGRPIFGLVIGLAQR